MLALSALAVSSVAAYFSIVGLITIFPAAATAILAMGISLEVAKLVTASWLYKNWAVSSVLIKTYFTSAVIILSIITSLGIFGFLSRAHIDQTATNADYGLNIEVIEFRLDAEKSKLNQARDRIVGLDDTLRSSQGKDKNYVNGRQRIERGELNLAMDTAVARIDELNLELLPMRQTTAKMDAELGPIKYIAELIYDESGKASVDKAVRIIIMLIIFVFDPLAILLVIAANMQWAQRNGDSITFIGDEAVDPEPEDFEIELGDEAVSIDTPIEVVKASIMDVAEEPTDSDDDWVLQKYGEPKPRGNKPDLEWLVDKK